MLKLGISSCLIIIALNCCFVCCEDDVFSSSSESSEDEYYCGKSGYVLVATVEGNLTALDFESGRKCWSIILDPKKFMSSTLSKLEVWENGTRVWLVPSLDGLLFKYDKLKLEPLPFNAESLLSQSIVLDQSTSIMGGKFKLVYGIHRHTGEVYYKCSIDGCQHFKTVSAKDALIVEQLIQSVNAVDSATAELRWHFRVVEIKLKVVSDTSSSTNTSYTHSAHFENNALMAVSNLDYMNPINKIKISLMNGYTARFNDSSFDFSWLYKTSAPMIDVWFVKDESVELLDPFADSLEFFTIDSDDGKHTALLFLGSYMDQLYVKQSRKLKTDVAYELSITRRTPPYQAFCLPLSLKPQPESILPANDTKALIPSLVDTKDHGFYYYINFSIFDNDTHCIVNFNYTTARIKTYDGDAELSRTITFIIVTCSLLMIYLSFKFICQYAKEFANEGTSTVEFAPIGSNSFAIRKFNTNFISRFHKDFELITILGKGGFGVVMEVKNKIDDCEYAVKRIRIRAKRYKELGYGSVMREVKALAKLDHPGIVRYFNSWVENPPKGWQDLKDKELDITDVSYTTTCEDEDNRQGSSDKIQKEQETYVLNPAAKLTERLLANPMNPFGDNLFDSPIPYNNENKAGEHSSHLSWKSDSVLKDDSGTLNKVSKRSVSQVSLCYDDDDISVGTEDRVEQLFHEKRHNVADKYTEDSNTYSVKFLEDSSPEYEVSNIRKLFSIPQDAFIDKSAVYLHLKKINNFLAWRMNCEFLKKLFRYIFFDVSCSDPHHSEWTGWTCILHDTEPNNVAVILYQLRIWLISVLSILRCNESHYHSILHYNLCNILWEVNLLLEDDVCASSSECSPGSSTGRIGAFFHLKNLNLGLAWPMKFVYLLKLRHYLLCTLLESNQCVQDGWKSIFYQFDVDIFRKNMGLFQIWILSILCKIQHEKLDFLNIVISNLSTILPEVISILQCKAIEPVSPNKFFKLFGDFIRKKQPKDIQLRDPKNTLFLVMFHNIYMPTDCELRVSEDDKPGYLYIQMQLCKRESLRNWLEIHAASRNYAEVMNMFCQIVDAMDYVHSSGLMHRDLKPSNIYFSLEGSIKIGDFGLATQFETQELGGGEALTSSLYYHTRHCGTDLYMSPEQRSKKTYNFKTDIFALGIILYELLVPFQTRSERYEAIYDVREHRFLTDFVKNCPNECQLVRRLLDYDPKLRPTASEIKQHPICLPYLQASRN